VEGIAGAFVEAGGVEVELSWLHPAKMTMLRTDNNSATENFLFIRPKYTTSKIKAKTN
jgi:hypothetical protein